MRDQRESLLGEGVAVLASDVGGTDIKAALVECACAGHGCPAHLASAAAIVSSSTQTTWVAAAGTKNELDSTARVEPLGRLQEEILTVDRRLRLLRASIRESAGVDRPSRPS